MKLSARKKTEHGSVAATYFAALAILAFVLLCVGAWQLGWFVQEKNQDQRHKVNTHSQEYQDALVQQERDRVQGYDVATDPAQKAQIKSTFCAIYVDLTQPPADLVQAHVRICQ